MINFFFFNLSNEIRLYNILFRKKQRQTRNTSLSRTYYLIRRYFDYLGKLHNLEVERTIRES